MATIGTFTRQDDAFTGEIRTMTLKAKATIKQVSKTVETAPDYRVFAAGVEIGAGWSVVSKANKPYLSIKLDDPSFPAAIYCRLIEGDKEHMLIWSR